MSTIIIWPIKSSPQDWSKDQVPTPPGQAGLGPLLFSSAESRVKAPRPDPAQFAREAHPIGRQHLLKDHYGKSPNYIRKLA